MSTYMSNQTRKINRSFKLEIHYWLGKETSQAERNVTASLANDMNVSNSSVVHQEIQGRESELFRSYFKNEIHYLSDSADSRLQHSSQTNQLNRVRTKRDVVFKSRPYTPRVTLKMNSEIAQDIFEAASKGDLDAVKYFITEKQIPVDSRVVGSGETPLFKAVQGGHMKVIEYLVKQGASINHTDKWGYNCLLWAVDQNKTDLNLIKYLVNHGVNVNLQDKKKGYTSLHWAAYHGAVDTVRYFIEKGADVNIKTKDGESPIDLAAKNGSSNVVEYLMNSQGVNYDIFQAADKGYLGVVKYFLEEQGYPVETWDVRGLTPLHRAAYNGRLEIVTYLLEEKGANINIKNSRNETPATPLHAAAEKGHLPVVQYLVEKGAEINAKDRFERTPLYWAADNGHLSVVKYLIDIAKADANSRDIFGNPLLHAAGWFGSLNVVKYLIEEKGVHVNIRDNDGFTALIESIQRGEIGRQVFQYLMQKGADIRGKDNHGRTPLHYAAQKGDLEKVKILVGKGVEINVKDNDDRTPLYMAADNGHLSVVRYLIDEKKADYNTRDKYGNPILHAAGWSGNVEVVKYLVEEKGVDVNITDNDNLTVLKEAITRNKVDLIKYLESKGALRNRRSTAYYYAGEVNKDRLNPVPAASSTDIVPTKTIKPYFIIGKFDSTKNRINNHQSPLQPQVNSKNVEHFEMTNLLSDGALMLADVSVRKLTGRGYKQPKHESLLTPKEIIERRIDSNVVDAIHELSAVYRNTSSF